MSAIVVYAYSPKLITISDCVFNAIASDEGVGCRFYNSNPVTLEHCSFLNFAPYRSRHVSGGVFYGNSFFNLPDGNAVIPMNLKSCLFDDSFTNAMPIMVNGSASLYDLRLSDCMMPTLSTIDPDCDVGTNGILLATNAVTRFGLLQAGSPAVDLGGPSSQGVFDIRGLDRDAHPDIGAAEQIDDAELDTDGDGIRDADEIAYGLNPFLASSDTDPIPDNIELEEGTIPTDPGNYCFDLTVTVTNPAAEYSLARIAYFSDETNRISEVIFVTNAVNVVELPHTRVEGGVLPNLWLWSDADTNGQLDAGEACQRVRFKVVSHTNEISVAVSQKLYDSDGDGMPDGWEIVQGLCPTNAADAYQNPDGDGLINLHEYWTRCNPYEIDGTNTALSIMATSIDNRLSENPAGRIAKFQSEGYGRVLNTNCWAYTIDTSCASPANSWYGAFKAGTAVTKRHVLLAKHYYLRIGDSMSFLGTDGQTYSRAIVGTNSVANTDIFICLLGEDLPDVVHPAKLLPMDYSLYIGSGEGLPALMFDFSEHAIVSEFAAFPQTAGVVNGRVPTSNLRQRYFEEVESGDSGDPKFLVFGTEPILVCTLLSYGRGNSGLGPFLTTYAEELQNVMDILSDLNAVPRESLQFFNFSSYDVIGE